MSQLATGHGYAVNAAGVQDQRWAGFMQATACPDYLAFGPQLAIESG